MELHVQGGKDLLPAFLWVFLLDKAQICQELKLAGADSFAASFGVDLAVLAFFEKCLQGGVICTTDVRALLFFVASILGLRPRSNRNRQPRAEGPHYIFQKISHRPAPTLGEPRCITGCA